ncbi:MAG: two-component system, NtrC family, response regulator HydG [Acidobacteriota bacterium]|jgi:Nif-specific regulatory protein|nr:two-component system, NtrC family, response regulator HydG [Acidobacteriota bacterium]
MYPRLAAIAGPLKGKTFTLVEDETSIGRESANLICLSDPSVSRRHCIVKRVGELFKINDLESLNGTFVNDVPVKERFLEHGDRVRIGDYTFSFLRREGDIPSSSSTVLLDESKIITGANTLQLRITDAFHLMARDLSALMKISTTINSVRGLEALQRQLLELIFEVVPADCGAILLVEDGQVEEFSSIFGLDRQSGTDRTVRVSRTITRRVLNEGISILSNEVQDSEAFNEAESLISSRIQAVLCVPLMLFDKPLGVIYLYASDPLTRFDKDQMQLVTAIAGIAAVALENARHVEWLESENQRLQEDIQVEHNMIGESQRMRDVYQFIARVAPTVSTVLIWGESGTGKELAARAIHLNSPRKNKPFIAVNCAALTETLLESELFGHEKGAFTGAVVQKKGKLEVADGGTLFLDEVGEMPQLLQAKLLRVLQEREFERVGGTRTLKVDIRLIAATNKDLEEAIRQGSFRQDLYYRLNVVALSMPPLRERREDISLLASYFVQKYSDKCNRRVKGISSEARVRLTSYDWPGNVRELENAIERAVVLGTTEVILPEDLPEAALETATPTTGVVANYHDAVTEAKKQLILKAVEQAGGNYTEAARLLGVHPNYLHRLIRNMNLRPEIKKQ